jgi:ActR/RegA family two-component response regulator
MCGSTMPPDPALAPLDLLVVDDDRNIHQDYERCLGLVEGGSGELDDLRDRLFGARTTVSDDDRRFPLFHALSGEQAIRELEDRLPSGRRFPVAFVDMRMSPGWNGIETIVRLWALDSELEIVVCTAFSDFTWAEVLSHVGRSEGLHLLRKPFDGPQVRRFAGVLTRKWELARRAAATARPSGKRADLG